MGSGGVSTVIGSDSGALEGRGPENKKAHEIMRMIKTQN